MRKHLFVTLALLAGMPVCGVLPAFADEAPQSQSQAAVTVRGTVLDENNEPVIGANVAIKGGQGVNTDVDGHFALKVKPGTKLKVSYIGYETMEVPATQDMIVYLQPTTAQLDQLVVVGYGTQKKADLTGAVATVDVARVMNDRATADVMKALQGSVPGLTILNTNGDINSAASIKIRGTGTLSNGQQSAPLIVVDGAPVDDLSFVDPSDIAEISVLKDAASSAIYGSRAAFGVILITTKNSGTKDRVQLSYSNNFGWSNATVLPEYGTVVSQLEALNQGNLRSGGEIGLFGMDQIAMIPYAQAWYEQNGGKKADYREMRPFQSWDDVGDYLMQPDGTAWYYADWDVKKIMFNNAAPSQRHNVSLEGTSGKTQYRLSFGYYGKQGIMNFNPDKLRRYNATATLSTEIFSWLKAGANINFSEKDYSYPFALRNTYTYMWRWGSYFGPYGYLKDEDGNIVDFRNDIAYRKQSYNTKDVYTQTRLMGWMQADLFKGMSLRADFTYNVINGRVTEAYGPVYCYNSWGNVTAPSYDAVPKDWSDARQTNSTDDMWTMNVYGTYQNSFLDGLNFKVMLGATAEQEDYNYFHAQKDQLLDYTLPYLGLTSGGSDGTGVSASQTITHRATAGFFGRLNLDYKGIYLLEANGRYDGSSRFPAADQWAFFPSVSAGYRFSEEGYFKPVKDTGILTNGKIRASYGHIGNEAVGSNRFISTISTAGKINWLQDGTNKVTAYNMPTLVSSTLSWERIITTDVGLDLGFLNNSLNVGFDWYIRDTKDMLGPGQDLPSTLGAGSPYQNNGSLRTKGWELSLGWNHSFGDADVYANVSLSDARTKITKWNNSQGLLYSWLPGQSNFYEGGYYGDIWGLETDRYFEESDFNGKDANGAWIYKEGVADQTYLQSGSFVYGPGDIKFKDLDGNGVINDGDKNMIDEATGEKIPVGSLRNHGDLKVIGNSQPRYEYSIRLGGAWKGFDIDMYFQGVGKRDMWFTSSFVMPMMRGADAVYSNMGSYNTVEFDDNNNIIAYNVNQSNDFPVMYPGGAGAGKLSGVGPGKFNFYPQTKYLMNMAYLRFKTLTVGYTLPYEITRKALIQKARIYFSADNLCLLYNGNKKNPIDPENMFGGSGSLTSAGDMNGSATFGRTAPMMRTFSCGLQVTF